MKAIYKIKQLFSNLLLFVRSLLIRTPERVQHDVPYVSQFASPGWVEMVLQDNQPATRDPLWEESGAQDPQEYERWVQATCGMACTSMLLQFFNKSEFRTVPLALDATKSGVYTIDNEEISSMQYQPYTTWVRRFGLQATIYNQLSFRSICTLLASGSLLIASVNPNIRGHNTVPKTQVGGHLVLVTGYNKKEKTLTIQNPSGFENNQSQHNHTLPVKVFTIYFAGRGIAVTTT